MKFWKRVFIFCVFATLSVLTLVIGNGYTVYQTAIRQMPLNEKLAQIQAKDNYTKLEEMPPIYKDAIISVEDHRFLEHKGIDVIAIGRALFNDIRTLSLKEGGSTITQQLAKNTYFTQEKKLERKIAEVFMAFEMEKTWGKDLILELYLNTSYYGDGYDTPKEAARGYFGKEPKEMTKNETVLLAGVPNAPSAYAPTKNFRLAKERQKQVLSKMVRYGKLTEAEAERIAKGEE